MEMILNYKGKPYRIEYGQHIGNHARILRRMLQDNHSLIYGKKVYWVYYDYEHYRPFSMHVKYLGKADSTHSWIDVPGKFEPQKVLTEELKVNYVGIF